MTRRAAGQLVAIGSSAGGPAALAKILGGLAAPFPAAIVVVQHGDENLAAGLTDWLARYSALPIRLAADGERPEPGSVLIAATSEHLVLTSGARLHYTAEPSNAIHRPSVDLFFQSVSRMWRGEVIGVLLTGMGRDGAVGLKALRDAGHHTIAQDQASSAVYGMPKEAAKLQAAVDILPVDGIAPRLLRLVRNG